MLNIFFQRVEVLSGRGLVRGGILVTAHVDNFLSSGRWNLRNFANYEDSEVL